MSKRTIIEIAERVGVSPATVSRALNNVPGVGPHKRSQILAVAAELLTELLRTPSSLYSLGARQVLP